MKKMIFSLLITVLFSSNSFAVAGQMAPQRFEDPVTTPLPYNRQNDMMVLPDPTFARGVQHTSTTNGVESTVDALDINGSNLFMFTNGANPAPIFPVVKLGGLGLTVVQTVNIDSSDRQQVVALLPANILAGTHELQITNWYPSGEGYSATTLVSLGDVGPTGPAGADSTVKGDKGDKGDRGLKGAVSTVRGPKGSTGSKGSTGARGLRGLKGNTGSVGSRGPQGPVGVASTCTYAGMVFSPGSCRYQPCPGGKSVTMSCGSNGAWSGPVGPPPFCKRTVPC